MPVTIKATPIVGRDLKPGDLFSTVGPEYWDNFPNVFSVGERVYIRTNMPAHLYNDADEQVYKIEVIYNEVPAGILGHEQQVGQDGQDH